MDKYATELAAAHHQAWMERETRVTGHRARSAGVVGWSIALTSLRGSAP